jgi:DNA topoisomerase-3
MEIIIAEKPELAGAIAAALGGGRKAAGYFECGPTRRITWCVGHMLELLEPELCDPKYQKWDMATLPFIEVPWRKRPIEKTQAQLRVIQDLIKSAKTIVHAGDPDDEGQLIVDEILEYVGYAGPVNRILINDNNPELVKRAYASMRPNREFKGLSNAANARGAADLFYGVSITRAYTLAAQAQGYGEVLHVGRVQTPITGLVVRRTRENAGHIATGYNTITAHFSIGGLEFTGRYVIKPGDPVDDKKRLSSAEHAAGIAAASSQKPAAIIEAGTSKKQTPAPLPYNLLGLQVDASRKYKFTPERTLEITQSLRDKHKLITYNRSDCEYLSDEHHEHAPAVLAAIATTAPVLAEAVSRADPTLKSRAFDSSKVSAHHGIIPTETTANIAALTDDERKIYLLLARAFIAQFWPVYLYDQTELLTLCGGHAYATTSRVATRRGWKMIYGNDAAQDEEGDDLDATSAIDLRGLEKGAEGACTKAEVEHKKTKPRPLYTTATLLMDLTRVAKYIKDDRLRKLLIEKDANKQGEHGGIGTPATRHAIMKKLFDNGYLQMRGDYIVSTAKAETYYDALPDTAKYPDMTALWHEQQKAIAAGERTPEDFIRELGDYMQQEIERVSAQGMGLKIKSYPCPKCSKSMIRRKAKEGDRYFWACQDIECKTTLPDKDGAPGERPKVSETFNCQGCGSGLIRRPGKLVKGKPGSYFWGCSGYPTCKLSYPDLQGRPNYAPKPDAPAKI